MSEGCDPSPRQAGGPAREQALQGQGSRRPDLPTGLRVVIVGPVHPFRGGIAHFTTSLANAAARLHSVEVLSFRRLYPKLLYPGGSDRDPSHDTLPLDFPVSYRLDTLNPFTWMSSARHVASLQADLVVVPWWTTFLALPLGWLARRWRRGGTPVVFLVHNVLPHEQRRFDPALARWTLRAGDGYVVLTESEKARLMELLPQASAIAVCPHPVYRFFASGRIDRAEARKRLGVPEGRPVLLFFGFVRPYKGVEVLLEAVRLLHSRGRMPYLLVAGEVWQGGRRLRERIESLGIQEWVRIDGRYIPNEEVGTYFSAADVFVAPYTAATQSGSLRVAMDFALPAVVSEAAAPPDFPATKGRVVPTGDPAALAQAIAEIIAVPGGPPAPSNPAENEDWSDLVATLVRVAGRARPGLLPGRARPAKSDP